MMEESEFWNDGEDNFEIKILGTPEPIEVATVVDLECPDYHFPKEAWPQLHQVYTIQTMVASRNLRTGEERLLFRFKEFLEFEQDKEMMLFGAERFQPLSELDI